MVVLKKGPLSALFYFMGKLAKCHLLGERHCKEFMK